MKNIIFFIPVFIAALWGGGLIHFAQQIKESTAPQAIDNNHAIITLTGGSDRLNQALHLLSKNTANRLFISGVGQSTDLTTLLILSGPLPDNIATLIPSITIGKKAKNTKGNAQEVSEWTQKHDIEAFLLVTANYHMPRSLIEFTNAMPEKRITPYPITPKGFSAQKWWKNINNIRIVMQEYHKYLWVMSGG